MSRFRGVSKNSNGGHKKWQARSYAHGSPKWLGNFATEEEAYRAILAFDHSPTRTFERAYRNSRRRLNSNKDALEENLHDPILPSQAERLYTEDWRVEREVSLRVAMLQQVQKDLKSPDPLVSEPARDWVRGLVDSPETFSFREICELCETDEKKARTSLLSS